MLSQRKHSLQQAHVPARGGKSQSIFTFTQVIQLSQYVLVTFPVKPGFFVHHKYCKFISIDCRMSWKYFKSMDCNPTIMSPKQYSFNWSLKAMFHQELVRFVVEGNVSPTAFNSNGCAICKKGQSPKSVWENARPAVLALHRSTLHCKPSRERKTGRQNFHPEHCPRPSTPFVMGGEQVQVKG
jgi:hypothetical protein